MQKVIVEKSSILANMAKTSKNDELKAAVYKENVEKVKALLSEGANPNFRLDSDRTSLLHVTRSPEVARELLLAGAYVNATNRYRETALHTAITLRKSIQLVRELLKHGVDVNAQSRRGYTALNLVIQYDANNLLIKELIEYGADIHIEDHDSDIRRNSNSSPLAKSVYRWGAYALIEYTLIRDFDKNVNYREIIDLSPYRDHAKFDTLSNYRDKCICEILQMKTDYIEDRISLYQLMKNVKNVHELYNNQLSAKLSSTNFAIRYPIYNDIILEKIKPIFERRDLLNKMSNVQIYTKVDTTDELIKEKKIILHHYSICNIAKYLCNDDLTNFIVAFENSISFTSSECSTNNLEENDKGLGDTLTTNEAKRAKLE